ncbi:O-antigen polymerase [Streptococcus pasteurianus]|uniref:O-antigen polymerase n=1 Tax=Streptococcus pasteurianus TaxID=197614 RepID=UPI001186B20F|nr:O-antigen polymerase [Streptococcus pasteurianus]
MSFLYILVIALIALLFLAYILSGRDVLSPSVTMVLMFILGTLFSIPNIESWKIDYSIEAGLLTISGILVFICVECFSRVLFVSQKNRLDVYQPVVDSLTPIPIRTSKLLFLIFINALVLLIYFLKIKSLVGGGSIAAIFQNYRRIGIDNLAGKDIETIGGVIGYFLKIVEASGFISGYILLRNLICKSKATSRVGLLLLLVMSILPNTFAAGRTQLLKLMSALIIYYYILWHQKYGWNRILTFKILSIGVSSLLVGIPTFYYGLKLLGRETARSIFDYAADYLGSGIVLFSEYVKNPIPRNIWGEESLYSVVKVLHFLGLSEPSTSYNMEFRRLGIGYSNVYSFFRRPLHDFGVLGMYLFVGCIAVFFAYMYYRKIKGNTNLNSTTYWTLVYGYFFYWIISSPIIQYSVAYVSVGTVTFLIILLLLFDFLTKDRIKLKLGGLK